MRHRLADGGRGLVVKCEAREAVAELLKDLIPPSALAIRDSEIARLKDEIARMQVIMDQRLRLWEATREVAVNNEIRIADLEGQLRALKAKSE